MNARAASKGLLRIIAALHALGLSLSLCGVVSAQPLSAALYEVTTETGMPHLEENLRYAVQSEQRCMDPENLAGAFWMLQRESLQDCQLQKTAQDEHAATYVLVCTGGHGTTGDAQWRIEAGSLSGIMQVKLGAKNMTFYQRIDARQVGRCPGG